MYTTNIYIYIYIYICIIYKPRLLGVFDIYTTRVRGSLPLGRGVYQWQTSDDQGQGEYICRIHLVAVVYMIYTMETSY